MNKKILGLALLSAVSLSQAATAQEFDNRWYVSGTLGYVFTDDDRNISNSEMFGVGVGKRLSPNFSIDVQYDQATPTYDIDPIGGDLDWSLQSLQVVGRYHFMNGDNTWNPFLAFGGGVQRHDQEYLFPNSGDGVNNRKGDDFIATLGGGFESDRRKRLDFRLEAGLRFDNDQFEEDDNGQSNEYGSYLDYYATASMLVKIGNLPVPVVAAPITCDTQDSDGDGVNDCNDKCPGSTAGQTIGADGCPVKLTIDLKGVNFDFDKATLRPDAVVILDEAVAVLAKYPELRFEVAGHTDLCGDEGYNQGLSERRAQTVYDYLTSKGIDAARMAGPTGYGESRPLESTEQTFPACKNETNRRTELNVQN
ncbi:MAG: OmpA family protein [Arenimonas sp.]|nr:OmpA family protein [Arenimonas sp.]MBP7917025.1 OmpA family protein [Arenimonas sp.]